MRSFIKIIAVSVLITPATSFAHGGGLNSEGCHNDHVHGGYHCHRGGGDGGSSQRIRPVYTPPKPSPNKATVREVQSLLTELKYKPGPIDGAAGKATKQAIVEFNNDYDSYVDVDSYDSVLSALQKEKRERDEAAELQIAESTSSSPSTTEEEGGMGGWLFGIFAVIGAYWLGNRKKR